MSETKPGSDDVAKIKCDMSIYSSNSLGTYSTTAYLSELLQVEAIYVFKYYGTSNKYKMNAMLVRESDLETMARARMRKKEKDIFVLMVTYQSR